MVRLLKRDRLEMQSDAARRRSFGRQSRAHRLLVHGVFDVPDIGCLVLGYLPLGSACRLQRVSRQAAFVFDQWAGQLTDLEELLDEGTPEGEVVGELLPLLRRCKGLRRLACAGSLLTSLPPLVALEALALHGVTAKHCAALATCPSVKELKLRFLQPDSDAAAAAFAAVLPALGQLQSLEIDLNYVDRIAAQLPDLPQLLKLDLSSQTPLEAAAGLFAVVQHFPQLTSLTIPGKASFKNDPRQFAAALACLSNLRCLDLGDNPVAVGVLETIVTHAPYLQILAVRRNVEQAVSPAEELKHLKQLRQLRRLTLPMEDRAHAEQLQNVLPFLENLQHLQIDTQFRREYKLSGMLGCLPLLESFDLSAVVHDGDNDGVALVEQVLKLPHLTACKLPGGLQEKALKLLAEQLQYLPRLRCLQLNSPAVDGFLLVAAQLHRLPELREFHVRVLRCHLPRLERHAATVLTAAFSSLPQLRVLRIEYSSFDARTIQLIAAELHRLPCLRILSLQDSGIDETAASSLARQLHHVPLLELLDLSLDKMGDTGLIALAAQLHHVARLRQLHLDWIGATSEGIVHLARALPQLPRLRVLVLGRNEIGDRGVEALAASVQNLRSLEELDVRYTSNFRGGSDFSDGSLRRLETQLCRHCPRLRSFLW